MLLLWSASGVIFIFAFVFAVVRLSWVYMLISAIASIPVTAYFFGAENVWQYIGFTPLVFFALTVVLWFLQKRRMKLIAA